MSDRVLEGPSAATGAAQAPPAASEAARVAARAFHMMGPDAEHEWVGDQAIAWEGLLDVTRRLRRGAEQVLLDGFDLSISMLGIMGRLSLAPGRTLRQTALAEAMGLSLSRVSRIIDMLEQRGILERRTCPADARATNVTLTRQGVTLTKRAQQELFLFVQGAFFDHIEADELSTLAAVFTRLLNLAPGAPEDTCGA
jgi:DNA-binding MarR family transcriptional regulator